MGRYDWEVAVLKCFKSLGGESELERIYPRIGEFVLTELKGEHFREQYGRLAFENQVRSHIRNLCEARELVQVDRARYRLTDKGLKRANTAPEVEEV